MKNKIFVLTAVHNDLKYTKKLLLSISKQTYRNFEVFLVDDGSTDGTADFIKNEYPEVKTLTSTGNLWWTASLNLGVRKILKSAKSGDYIWTINNDCIIGKDYLSKLINFVRSIDRKTIIGSVVVDEETKKVVENGVSIDWSKLKFSSGGNDALPTKGTLFPIEVFNEIGDFDEKHFPHYFSDYEYTIRAKRGGYKLEIFDEVTVKNFSQRTGYEKVGKSDILKVLFSRKSKLNIFTQMNMIFYVCPKEYRLKCLFLLLSKAWT